MKKGRINGEKSKKVKKKENISLGSTNGENIPLGRKEKEDGIRCEEG